MTKTETTLIIIPLSFGILSKTDLALEIDHLSFSLIHLITINFLAFYYLLKNKKSIYTLFFALSLLTQIGSLLKFLHLHYAAVFLSVGLISQITLFSLFIVRPLIEKEKKDVNFYLISSVALLMLLHWFVIIFNKTTDISPNMIINIFILVLIGLLNIFAQPKNSMNKFEFDILTYTFVMLFVGTLDFYI